MISVLTKSFLANKGCRQFVFDTLLAAYSQRSLDVPSVFYRILIYSPTDIRFLINPAAEGIQIKDIQSFTRIIEGIIILRIRDYLLGKAYQTNDALYNQLIQLIDRESIFRIQEYILSEAQNVGLNDDNILDHIPPSIFDKFPPSCEANLSPKMRFRFYYRTNNVSYILDNSIIDYWNKLVANNDQALILSWNSSVLAKDYDRISSFIAANPSSTDLLLFIAFLIMSNPACLSRISDRSLYSTWLPKKGDLIIRKYLGLAQLIPREELIETVKYIGFHRVADIVEKNNIDFIKYYPKELLVHVVAKVQTLSEKSFTENSDWYGGYFTWGEGMKHQKYDSYTYLVKQYYTVYYIENNYYPILDRTPRLQMLPLLREQVQLCLENKKETRVFASEIQGKDYLIVISLQIPDDSTYTQLYEDLSPQKVKVLLNSETFIDD